MPLVFKNESSKIKTIPRNRRRRRLRSLLRLLNLATPTIQSSFRSRSPVLVVTF